jgi:diguanylate cyclase (GGDEF)-like protein
MPRSYRLPQFAIACGLIACTATYATLAQLKPYPQWNLFDIVSEGSIAVMACLWFVLVQASRPAGRTTALLAAGLAGLTLGAWADVMDELFAVAKGQQWNHMLESGVTLAGMLLLTAGLYYWRREQLMVSEHLLKRERLFRDHRAFDHVTQLGDADYLREQLRLEQERGSATSCTLVMFDIDDFHVINRQHGQREGDRLLQAVTHLMLLNLRNCDLLCRYAGDRFALLMPDTSADQAQILAEHLRRAVTSLRHYPVDGGMAVQTSVRFVLRQLDGEPRQLLKELNGALERRMAPAASPDSGTDPCAAHA